MNIFDITLIGSGIVGSTLALALAKKTALNIAIIDSHSPSYDSHRVSAISPASRKIFSDLHIWEQLSVVSPYQKMHVWDAHSTGEIHFDSETMKLPALGYIIEDQHLRRILHESFKAQLAFFHPVCLNSLRETSQGFELIADDQQIATKLVIAADGANSWVRAHRKIELTSWAYGQTAIVATVNTALPHQQTAWQRFLSSGPLAFLPLSDPHTVSIVWSTQPDSAEKLMCMNDDEFSEALTDAFAHRLGQVTLVSERQCFPLRMRHARQYVQPRLALVGDAAHTIHPLAGLGVNMGLQDAMCLLDVIVNAVKKHRDFSSFATLRAYERARKNENLTLLAGVEGLKRLFASESALIQELRAVGLNMTNQASFLKNFFARYAVGLPTIS